jgi:hypothetical protein
MDRDFTTYATCAYAALLFLQAYWKNFENFINAFILKITE